MGEVIFDMTSDELLFLDERCEVVTHPHVVDDFPLLVKDRDDGAMYEIVATIFGSIFDEALPCFARLDGVPKLPEGLFGGVGVSDDVVRLS